MPWAVFISISLSLRLKEPFQALTQILKDALCGFKRQCSNG